MMAFLKIEIHIRMRLLDIAAASCALLLTLGLSTHCAAQSEILLKLRSSPAGLSRSSDGYLATTGDRETDAVLQKCGAATIRSILLPAMLPKRSILSAEGVELTRWLKVTLPRGVASDSVLAYLRKVPAVVEAQPNRIFRLHHIPNDPFVVRQYALTNIHAYPAWDVQRGRPEVIVGVIDTGIDYAHPDLQPNIWINGGEDLNRNGRADTSDYNGIDDDDNGFVDDIQGWDFTDAPNYPDGGDYRDRDADPMDEMGHGTAVAGIIAAVMDNGIGMAGVAPGCRLMNVRSFTAGGLGEEDDAASAILYAIANGARVINMSWGDVFISRLLDDVIKYAVAQNVVMVASSGNSGTDRIHYPSAFAGVISVGASTADDAMASFSNFGPTLDLVAPGAGILSTTREAKYDSSLNGTSFAAPFVSAAAALILSQDQTLPAETVRGILIASADDLGSPGWDVYYGAGRLNLERALSRASGPLVGISHPWLDQGFAGGNIEIYGSAWSPAMEKFTLSYGIGQNPDKWLEIASVTNKRVIDGLLAVWQTGAVMDTAYTVRLQVFDRSGVVSQSAVRLFIDQTPPNISHVQWTPMWENDYIGVLLGFNTDDLCEGAIFWRPQNSAVPWQRLEMGYRARQHQLLLSPELAAAKIQIMLIARNTAGLESFDDNNGRYYLVDLTAPPIDRSRFTPTDHYLPHGHVLHTSADFNGDSRSDLVIGYYDGQNQLTTAVFAFNGSDYQKLAELPRSVIPRGIGDSDGDGRLELLCGYGFSSYLYEVATSQPLTFTLKYTWSDETHQYWAADMADIDGDGKDEIIMRTVSGNIDLFKALKQNGDTFVELGQMPNPTAGENINGVPRCRVGDFDGDGRMEILLGDSDGDVYLSEYNGNGFAATWQDRLPLLDTIDYLSSGDYDGDGLLEFVVGCHSDPTVNTEHYFDSRHWLFRIYKRLADNAFQTLAEWRFFGFESPKDFASGVSSGDVDGDGRDEIACCVFPDFYLMEFDPILGYPVVFHCRPVETNAAAIADTDGDGQIEMWLSDGRVNRPYIQVGASTAPPVPVGVTAQPLNESQVVVKWYPVPGAQHYTIYRGADEQQLLPLTNTQTTALVDTNLTADCSYFYAVVAHDSTKTPRVSALSAVAMARPGAQPFVVAAEMASRQSVRLRFSEPMHQTVLDPHHYQFDKNLGKPSSCAMDASGKEVLLHLQWPFAMPGEYSVAVSDLMDVDRTPLDTTRRSARFHVVFPQKAPYIVDGRLEDERTVLITFNEPMEAATLALIENYDLGKHVRIQVAIPQPPLYDAVKLQITGNNTLGPLGKTFTLRVRNVKNSAGVAIIPGYGDVLQLLFAADNLDNLFTYPNPYRVGLDHEGITFAGLPIHAEIRIMTLQGYPLRTLYEDNGDGGVHWDVRDDHGRPLAAGIYIYRVVSGKMVKMGKLAIVR